MVVDTVVDMVVPMEDIPEEDTQEHMMKYTTHNRTQITIHHHPQIHPCESIIQAIRASGSILTTPQEHNGTGISTIVKKSFGAVVRALLKFLSDHLDME